MLLIKAKTIPNIVHTANIFTSPLVTVAKLPLSHISILLCTEPLNIVTIDAIDVSRAFIATPARTILKDENPLS